MRRSGEGEISETSAQRENNAEKQIEMKSPCHKDYDTRNELRAN
jgi:hypothetical protein